MMHSRTIVQDRTLSTVESPHLAIIHLLRAKGCCSDQQNRAPQPIPDSSISKLVAMRQALEKRLSDVNMKLRHVPCAIKLQKEVNQLEVLCQGLRGQNEMRRHEGTLQNQKFNRTVSTRGPSFHVRGGQSNTMQLIEEQLRQNRKLEDEYHDLMLKIRKLHNQNEGIVNNFDRTWYNHA